MSRLVVILCGPPGAGKTTAARASGLAVYDADDERWSGQGQFVKAIARLAHDPDARAVVIRTASTSTARSKWARMTQATHVLLVEGDAEVCTARVKARGRDVRTELAAVADWFTRHERRDHVATFTTWADLPASSAPPPPARQGPTAAQVQRTAEYASPEYREARRILGDLVAQGRGQCWRCEGPIAPGERWHVGHDDDDRSWIRGAEHPTCNLHAAGVKSARMRREAATSDDITW